LYTAPKSQKDIRDAQDSVYRCWKTYAISSFLLNVFSDMPLSHNVRWQTVTRGTVALQSIDEGRQSPGALKMIGAPSICIYFYRAMRCISAVFPVMQCPSVRLSVRLSDTFVDHVKTNKYIFEIFSPSDSNATLVSPHQRDADIPTGTPPNGGVECKGYEKSRFSTIIFTNISLYLRNDYS